MGVNQTPCRGPGGGVGSALESINTGRGRRLRREGFLICSSPCKNSRVCTSHKCQSGWAPGPGLGPQEVRHLETPWMSLEAEVWEGGGGKGS